MARMEEGPGCQRPQRILSSPPTGRRPARRAPRPLQAGAEAEVPAHFLNRLISFSFSSQRKRPLPPSLTYRYARPDSGSSGCWPSNPKAPSTAAPEHAFLFTVTATEDAILIAAGRRTKTKEDRATSQTTRVPSGGRAISQRAGETPAPRECDEPHGAVSHSERPCHLRAGRGDFVWPIALCRIYAVGFYFIHFTVSRVTNLYVALNRCLHKGYASFYNRTYLSCVVIKIAYADTGNPGEHRSSKREPGHGLDSCQGAGSAACDCFWTISAKRQTNLLL